MENNLQKKIDALGLLTVDETSYNKYLKPHEEAYKQAKLDINYFKYYKLYGQEHMLYSVGYLERTSMEELLENDKYNHCLFKKE